MKKFLLAALSLVTVAVVSITGTVAFLQDEKSDVNVMTTGNVSIEQIEQEWNAGKTALQDFTQAKPLYPYVGNLGWENKTDNGGAYRRFTMNNVVDKYVSVKNTGKSDAYVRTIIALEMGSFSYADLGKIIGASTNNYNGSEFQFPGAWDWTDDFVAEIDGKNYNIMVAVHKDAIEPGETTIPSLLQVYMNKDATNEDCEKIDGNGNGTYDILVLSQAVQTAGFADAETALDAAFGDITTTKHPWSAAAPAIPDAVVASADEFKKAIAKGGNVMLTDDIELTGTLVATKDAVIDLNGNKMTAPSSGAMFQSQSNASPDITITSSAPGAEINVAGGDTSVLLGYGKTVIKNVTINVTGCDNATPNPFKVYGDLTLGEGTVVNVDYLGTAIISNNGAHKIVIDGAKINIGTFKTNGTAIITLNNASTLEMKNTAIKIGEFVLSSFGGDSLVSKVDGVTIDGCTFNVTDSNGASCTFVAKDGKYRLVQK